MVAASQRPKLALSALERRAVTALVAGENAADLERYVSERASAYATGNSEVRRRAISRALAVQDALVQQLSALLAGATAVRDDKLITTLDRALNSATARYRSLIDQLRIESSTTRRVLIAAKGAVVISAEETL
jgi:flagellar basal body P-ring protein FlgI